MKYLFIVTGQKLLRILLTMHVSIISEDLSASFWCDLWLRADSANGEKSLGSVSLYPQGFIA